MSLDSILSEVAHYYTGKLRAHGPTPAGVDWNSEDSQHLRFQKLMELTTGVEHFSVLDYGCGYGALFEFLRGQKRQFSYCGFDISSEMLAQARQLHEPSGARFVGDFSALQKADFVVASGIFNVRLDVSNDRWKTHVEDTLDRLHSLSTTGFAFNLLTSHADPERMRNDLFYADPLALFERCRSHYSRRLSLLHDYPLYEFTILVRK